MKKLLAWLKAKLESMPLWFTLSGLGLILILFLVWRWPLFPPPQPTPLPPQPDAISGVVYCDTEASGTQGHGLPSEPDVGTGKVKVELYEDDGGTWVFNAFTMTLPASSPNRGAYIFPNLAPAAYELRVDGASLPPNLPIANQSDPAAGWPNVTMSSGLTVGGVNFGFTRTNSLVPCP